MADSVVNLADRRSQPTEPVALDDCICKTYGAQFGSLAYQVERGEYSQALAGLRELAELYADEPMPDKAATDA